MSGAVCDLHGTEIIGVGFIGGICPDCAEEAYQREKGQEQPIFEAVRSALPLPAILALLKCLDRFPEVRTYEIVLRAITMYSLGVGCSIDEVLARIARDKSAEFLFPVI